MDKIYIEKAKPFTQKTTVTPGGQIIVPFFYAIGSHNPSTSILTQFRLRACAASVPTHLHTYIHL